MKMFVPQESLSRVTRSVEAGAEVGLPYFEVAADLIHAGAGEGAVQRERLEKIAVRRGDAVVAREMVCGLEVFSFRFGIFQRSGW